MRDYKTGSFKVKVGYSCCDGILTFDCRDGTKFALPCKEQRSLHFVGLLVRSYTVDLILVCSDDESNSKSKSNKSRLFKKGYFSRWSDEKKNFFLV